MLDVGDGEVSEQDRGIVGSEQKGGKGSLVVQERGGGLNAQALLESSVNLFLCQW